MIDLKNASPSRLLVQDPRVYQILVLASLLVYGVVGLDFDVRPLTAVAIVLTALAVQYLGGRLAGLDRFEPKSALISALSLCLLLRTGSPVWAMAAAALAVGSKFVLRVRGKHVFNPTNFAIVALMVTTGKVWVSPGQWGSAAFFAFLLLCLGGLVVNRAARSDVTFAFLASYFAVLFGRAAWLGQPWSVPLHQLASGAFLLNAIHFEDDAEPVADKCPVHRRVCEPERIETGRRAAGNPLVTAADCP